MNVANTERVSRARKEENFFPLNIFLEEKNSAL